MKEMRFKYCIAVMCGILHVSKSGYYRWLNRKPSKRVVEEGRLEVEIKAAHKRTRETCGPERLQHELKDQGVSVGKVQGHHRFQAYAPCGRESTESAI
jgi:putative transposase